MKKKLLAVLLVLSLLFAAVSCAPADKRGEETTPPEANGMKLSGADWQKVAKNDRFTLEVAPTKGWMRLTDAKGTVWETAPVGYEADELARGSTKRAMQSLLLLQVSDLVNNISTINSMGDAVEDGGVNCYTLSDGARFTFFFAKEGITLSVDLRLKENGLSVSVPLPLISEESDTYRLISLCPMPYFGAAANGSEGYIFVPDGSGALIDLDRTDKATDDYTKYVYGREPSTLLLEKKTGEESVLLPVFGLKNADNAFFAVMSEGESRGMIQASVAGKRCNYSNVYSQFIYRDSEMVTIQKTGQSVRVIEDDPDKKGSFTTDYYFLSGEDASYTGMANLYGDLLFGEKRAADAPLMTLKLVGGLMQEDDSFGIPVDRVLPLTTYDAAKNMIEELTAGGATSLAVRYVNAMQGGDRSDGRQGIAAENRLGGSGGLTSLLNSLNEKNIILYPQVDFVRNFSSNGGSISVTAIQGSPAVQYFYRPNSGAARMTEPFFLLNQTNQQKAVDRTAADLAANPWQGIDASTLGSTVYSDFQKQGITRAEAQKLTVQRLKKLKEAAGSLFLSAPNAYALSLADLVTDLPSASSGYYVTDESVPFYALVCHGRVAAYSEVLNQSADEETAFLQAMETGLCLQYAFVAENAVKASDSRENPARGILYADWEEKVLARYKESEAYLSLVAASPIVQHCTPEEDVKMSVFENGVSVIVNYSDKDWTDDAGNLVPAKDFLVLGN